MHSHQDGISGGAFFLVHLLLLAFPLLLLTLYLGAVALQRNTGRRWSRWRTSAFVAGAAIIMAALLPPLASLAHHDPRVHMLQHLLLGMLGPIGLVLGAPLTLALRTVSASFARRLVGFLHTPPVQWLAHPLTALVLNIGGMALLYTTPLYARMLDSSMLHLLVHMHFLAAGCLFSWAIVGIDPGSARKSHAYRLVVLFLAMATHATLSKGMYAYGWPAGTPHTLREIEQAAQIMYYGGDLSELLLAVVLFGNWSRRWRLSARSAAGLSVSL